MGTTRMFDKDSFKDEITNSAEAKSAVHYLSHNEFNFQQEMIEDAIPYDEQVEIVGQIWRNLVKSCRRVKYSDFMVEAKAKQYQV